MQDRAADEGEGFFSQRARARPMNERKAMIKVKQELSVIRQCGLLAVPRSHVYVRKQAVSEFDLALMRQLDALYLQRPF